MPINSPPLITNTGNNQSLFGVSNIPDPFIVNDLTVNNSSLLDGTTLINDLTALNAEISGNLIVENNTISSNLIVNDSTNLNNTLISNLTVSSGSIILIDGAGSQNLQAIGGDLYFNNELLAKANDIQDIADWSLYPALANVNIDNKDISNVNLLSAVNIDITTLLNGNEAIFTGNVQSNATITNSVNFGVDTLTTDITHNLLYNGQIVQVGDIPQSNTITGVDTFDVADGGIDISNKAIATITAKNGLSGEVNILADAGYLGSNGGKITMIANGGQLFGEVDITANEGTIDGITTGGSINLIANSGGALETLTSKITLNAGGINIYSGIGSPFGSLFGYTYINASLGISLVAGAFTSGFQSPGTVYLYGTNGIVLGTDTYARTIYPYSGGLISENLIIKGRSLPTTGRVYLEDVDHMYMTGAGEITGVATINGAAYPPAVDIGVSSLNTLTGALTLTAGSNISFTTAGNDITIDASSTSTPAVGGAGAIQYSNGSGVFEGSANILYNGDTKITNTIGTNFIDMNEVANLNSIAIESSNQVNITGTTLLGLNGGDVSVVAETGLRIEINTSLGTAGQVLTSDGTYTIWQTPAGVFVDSFQIYVSPNGNDTTGTGSQQKPYLTIAQAITQRATLSQTIEVSIVLSSGTYTESFTLVRNTFLVGVQTGEVRQPCNITGNITMSDTLGGSIGLSGLEIVGTINMTGVGGLFFTIFGCNISSGVSNAITANSGSLIITESRITTNGGICILSATSITVRDCVIVQTGTSSCIETSGGSTIIRQSFISSTSILSTVSALIKMTNTGNSSSEITFNKIEYTSNTTDTVGNKCCIQFAGAGFSSSQIFNCLLLCQGAITGGATIDCIQDTGAGAVNISYGQLIAGATAHHISSNATKTQYITVP